MAQIHNTDCLKGLAKNAGIQQNRDSIPNQLADKIVPTFETNPQLLRDARVLATVAGRNTTGSGIIVYNAQPNKAVYITGIQFANNQTAASDNILMNVSAIFEGARRRIYSRHKPTLTAMNFVDHVMFTKPLLIDRNTEIQADLLFTVGASITDIIIYGYTDDVVNA